MSCPNCERLREAVKYSMKLGDLCPNDFRSKKAEMVASVYEKLKDALALPSEEKKEEGVCKGGCTYSRSMNQAYPRKCIHCGKPEPSESGGKKRRTWSLGYCKKCDYVWCKCSNK